MRPGLCLLLLLVACAAPRPAGVPRDVPDPLDVARHEASGFRVWADADCLGDDATQDLLAELASARAKIEAWLGAAAAPGDFRPPGQRAACPADLELGPRRDAGTIEVVVVRRGERCHADAEGITLQVEHLPRKDATHELVHYLAGNSWRPLDAGLAVWLTEEVWGPDKGWPLEIRARAYRDLNLPAELHPRRLDGGMSRRDYDVAGAFVGWLVRTYGKEKLLRLYAGAERDYFTVYGQGEQDLLDRFWKHVAGLPVRHDSAYHAFKAHRTRNR